MKKQITVKFPTTVPITGTLIDVDYINETATIEYDEEETMTSLPESVLIWRTTKPTFEEVKGRKVYVENTDGICVFNKDMDGSDYLSWFRYDFIRYAIIADPEPEPLALWGVKPEMISNVVSELYFAYRGNGAGSTFQIISCVYPTRAEAITAWNRIAEKLGEVAI